MAKVKHSGGKKVEVEMFKKSKEELEDVGLGAALAEHSGQSIPNTYTYEPIGDDLSVLKVDGSQDTGIIIRKGMKGRVIFYPD